MAVCPPVLGWDWEQEGSWHSQAAPLRFRAGRWGRHRHLITSLAPRPAPARDGGDAGSSPAQINHAKSWYQA